MPQRHVFVTGGTGYVGSRLIPLLTRAGHRVTALVRPESRHKLPAGCAIAMGDALRGDTYRDQLEGVDTFVQLVGVSHPGPGKAREFVDIDLKAGLEAIRVARAASVDQFVYVSVAHPAPVMQAYIAVRSQCEQALRDSGMNASILRPWYVLGPGHRWPYALLPFYKLAEFLPSTRESAQRLGLVTLEQMLNSLVAAVDQPAQGVRVIEVPRIRAGGEGLEKTSAIVSSASVAETTSTRQP